MTQLQNEALWTSKWRCPSNIALVKYWGKRDFQKPMNQSLSFVLQNSFTEMSVELFKEGDQKVEFYFEGLSHPFGERIESYLAQLSVRIQWIEDYNFRIHSRNSFPHSAGIASSASSFGALALCLAELHFAISGKEPDTPDLWRKASELARLGSGSACRSIYPGFSIWGKAQLFEVCSDEYATPLYEGINPVFYTLRDAILIVDSGVKAVSSTIGHMLMNEHVYQPSRIAQAHQNLNELYLSLLTGNKESFVEVVESEALSLHALMMTSRPSYMLLKPNTLELISRIRAYREKTKIPVCFTLDAGPNIHLLYFKKNELEVRAFIEEELLDFCENRQWIDDRIGKGPERIIT
ncbi:MAG TPA: diphosphomevalonate decarboxylase [Prolixibacteraceae bacterium]|jgi:diphosphomevalonate decarboxylase|nr:diphosphomevalonate decarboxylase [Prolixibacteraceae bacterium]